MSKKILVVDDDKGIQSLIKISLEIIKPWQVKSVFSGIQVIEILKRESFDMILSDYLMPDMNGLQLAEKLYKDPKMQKIPFVLFTAVQSSSIIKKTDNVKLIIPKPFNIVTIGDILEEILE